MRHLFYGFLLMFLSFDLTINGHQLDVLPDFVGYFLLIRGMKELEPESTYFGNGRPFAMGMVVYTALLWAGELLAVTGEGTISQLLGLVAEAAALYISWLLIRAVWDMEESRNAELNGHRLHSLWKGLLAVQLLWNLLGLLMNLANFGILVGLIAILGIAGLVLNILYLMAWWKGTRAYEALSPRPVGPEIF